MKKWIFTLLFVSFIVVGCSQEDNDIDIEQLEAEYEELLEKIEEKELEYEQLVEEVEQLRQELEEPGGDSEPNDESDPNGDNGENGQEEEPAEEPVEGIDGSITLDQGYYIIGADLPSGSYLAQADGAEGLLSIRGPDGTTKYENIVSNEGVSIELEQGDTFEIEVSTTLTVE
ncbi:hypothetical protein ACERJO_11615 [Halalkalibacter sp. AB-rgal2]|uniref:hypothetical protein n=1 Tax=Halalkalibacter sp. AB-rgal2 TaxID=3242695 RepID=UPI00359DC0E1